ncbi:MAG: hypothetical protein CMK09_17405 [Ponticaulis sp.]|nr:hypothetical protein [Ponticaulis sp.]|tara:strand:+ start:1455 stop:1937 length:483 start_codon:yes stop_codon:yes gene_type:complete
MPVQKTIFIVVAMSCLFAVSACSGGPTIPEGDWLSFSALEEGASSNRALTCTPEICPSTSDFEPAAEFGVPADRLADAVIQIVPEAQRQEMPNGDIRIRYVAVTAIMRFRDDVDLLIRPEGENSSVLAAYSRSRVGRSDLGKNASRIDALVKRLEDAVAG